MMIITAWDSLKTDLDLLRFGDLSFHAGFRPLGLSTRVLSYPPHPPTMPSKGQDVCMLAGCRHVFVTLKNQLLIIGYS